MGRSADAGLRALRNGHVGGDALLSGRGRVVWDRRGTLDHSRRLSHSRWLLSPWTLRETWHHWRPLWLSWTLAAVGSASRPVRTSYIGEPDLVTQVHVRGDPAPRGPRPDAWTGRRSRGVLDPLEAPVKGPMGWRENHAAGAYCSIRVYSTREVKNLLTRSDLVSPLEEAHPVWGWSLHPVTGPGPATLR